MKPAHTESTLSRLPKDELFRLAKLYHSMLCEILTATQWEQIRKAGLPETIGGCRFYAERALMEE